jgi:hypothetical protein
MRLIACSVFLASAMVTTAFADPPPKCTIVKVNDADVSINIDVGDVSLKGAPVIFCKTRSRKLAEAAMAEHKVCHEPGKGQNKYVVTWGVPGKEERFELPAMACKNK